MTLLSPACSLLLVDFFPKLRNFPKSGGKSIYLKFPPKTGEFPQIWGNLVGRKHIFFQQIFFQSLVWKEVLIITFFYGLGMSMSNYSFLRIGFLFQKPYQKFAIAPDLGNFPSFENCNRPRSGEIPQIWVSPDCIIGEIYN